MKTVMLSIHPKWCELIANEKKTIEIRKTKPNLDTPFKCYIYCTKQGRPLVYGSPAPSYTEDNIVQTYGYSPKEADRIWGNLQGKVIGEFTCRFIDEYKFDWCDHPEIGLCDDGGDNWYEIDDGDLLKARMSEFELKAYGKRKDLFGWHISDLTIYESPLNLSDWRTPDRFSDCNKCDSTKWLRCPVRDSVEADYRMASCRKPGEPITKPPQSWCYVEEKESFGAVKNDSISKLGELLSKPLNADV